MPGELSLWTVYDHPLDDEDFYVARRWLARSGDPVPFPTADVLRHTDLESLRRVLAGYGLSPLPRGSSDDPVIIETWI